MVLDSRRLSFSGRQRRPWSHLEGNGLDRMHPPTVHMLKSWPTLVDRALERGLDHGGSDFTNESIEGIRTLGCCGKVMRIREWSLVGGNGYQRRPFSGCIWSRDPLALFSLLPVAVRQLALPHLLPRCSASLQAPAQWTRTGISLQGSNNKPCLL